MDRCKQKTKNGIYKLSDYKIHISEHMHLLWDEKSIQVTQIWKFQCYKMNAGISITNYKETTTYKFLHRFTKPHRLLWVWCYNHSTLNKLRPSQTTWTIISHTILNHFLHNRPFKCLRSNSLKWKYNNACRILTKKLPIITSKIIQIWFQNPAYSPISIIKTKLNPKFPITNNKRGNFILPNKCGN